MTIFETSVRIPGADDTPELPRVLLSITTGPIRASSESTRSAEDPGFDDADVPEPADALSVAGCEALASRENWSAHGACRNPVVDRDDFFLESRFAKNSAAYNAAKRRAKAFCNICMVREQCLNFALSLDIRDGIWGGTTANDRRNLRWPKSRREGDVAS